MIIRCYAVYDAKLSDYRLAIFDIKDEGAIRNFSDLVKDPQSGNWNKHPEDYSLWYVGQFDSSKGMLKSDHPVNLINASAIVSLIPKMELFDKNGEEKKEPLEV